MLGGGGGDSGGTRDSSPDRAIARHAVGAGRILVAEGIHGMKLEQQQKMKSGYLQTWQVASTSRAPCEKNKPRLHDDAKR